MSELGLPGTGKIEPPRAGAENRLGAGIHLVKIDKVVVAMKNETTQKLDSRNYPGVIITFKSKVGEAADGKPILGYIDGLFYYDPAPEDAEHRKDPNKFCKSEFNLRHLKGALGFGPGPVSMKQLKSVLCWTMVREIHPVYSDTQEPILGDDGNQLVFTELAMTFWPKSTQPAKAGDPRLSSNGKASGDFVIIKKWTRRDTQSKPQSKEDKKDYGTRDTSPYDETKTVAPDEAQDGETW